MVKCWAVNPVDRPQFTTLQQDLDQFEEVYENKYGSYDLPIYKKPVGGKREDAMRRRRKKRVP